ncbi:MAG: TRAP transporter fused permease subunit [Proteobacteria bacterium]|nr:TRAP transporter fused permease subunit [Pseudomonadota bacterium]
MSDLDQGRGIGARIGHFLSLTGEGHRSIPGGFIRYYLWTISVLLTGYITWYALFSSSNRHLHAAFFIVGVLPIVFLTTTISKAFPRLTVFDYLLAALSFAVGAYYVLNDAYYYNFVEGITAIPVLEQAIGVTLVALSVEACRRTIGWGLTSVVIILLTYVAFGHLLGGELYHDPIDLPYFLTLQSLTHVGIFGAPVQVAATYAYLFVLFGAFYQRAGGGQLFFDIAAIVAGRSVGGAAKACVVSSGLYGSISGSPTADVVTTGPITIPLMKRVGVSAIRAGAIESSASTGGALLPPVMGAVAFMMVEFTGIPYAEIIVAGIIIALLYYFGVFLMIHYEAQRFGEGQIDEADIVTLRVALKRGWVHILPIFALVYFLVNGYSPTYVAAGSTVFVVFASWLNPDPKGRIGPRMFVESCTDTVYRIAVLTGAVLGAGAIIGCIELSGLAGKFTLMLYYVAGDGTVAILIASSVVLILLGMGMPTPGVYIMGVALIAPVLVIDLGLPLLEAHLFMLYFACMSAITPPMATACFSAATIAEANPMVIAVYAVKQGIAGFVLPFYFVFNPGVLGLGSVIDVVSATFIGMMLVVVACLAVHGWMAHVKLPAWLRLGLVATGIALIYPRPETQYAAAAIAAVVYIVLHLRARAATATQVH